MQNLRFFAYSPFRFLKINHNHCHKQTLIAKHHLYYEFTCSRAMSQSTSIPKKQQRVRDHGYDNYMEVYKKIRKVLKFQDIIHSQPNRTICVSRLDTLARRLGFKQHEAGAFILKFPHVFEIYEHPVQRILYCRLTRKANLQIEQESQALQAQIPDAITRLRKLLMLSKTARLRLEHIRIARRDFGLPDDFEFSVILKNPQFFRLFDAEDPRSKYVEIVDEDPSLAVCAIEKLREKEYRERGIDAENIRFSFIVNFPPGFKIGKYYKIAVWKWQRLPYWSPYEDVSGHDLRSLEAQKRMEKRAIATIHELLSLTVEKKLSLERIAHFRMAMDLPSKLKEFLLQHQGIFYISTRGNYGKLHTVFLREAYRKGELIEPNDLYLARRKLAELILLSPRKARVDRDLFDSDWDGRDGERREIRRDRVEDRSVGFRFEDKFGIGGGQEEDLGSGTGTFGIDGEREADLGSETGTLGINGEQEEDLGSETGGESDSTGEESDDIEMSDEEDVHCTK